MNRREIAEALLGAYEESGKSYGELSRETGIPKSMIQRYLAGTVDRIPIERLDALCRALGLDAKELLGWTADGSGKAESGKVVRSMTPQQAVLFDASEGLTDDERNAVINMINAFKAARGD